MVMNVEKVRERRKGIQDIERRRRIRALLKEAYRDMSYIETQARMTKSQSWTVLYWEYDQYIKDLKASYHSRAEVL